MQDWSRKSAMSSTCTLNSLDLLRELIAFPSVSRTPTPT